MTRIIAGSRRGRSIATPPGNRTRPTSDRVRESLFGSLSAMRDLEGARVLDLFAGSGAVGFEAASRGASKVLLVESHAKTTALLRRNTNDLGFQDRVAIVTAMLPGALKRSPDEPYDVIFVDPPYNLSNDALTEVLGALVKNAWLAPDCDVIVERSSRSDDVEWPTGITLERSRRYGESTLWYGRGL